MAEVADTSRAAFGDEGMAGPAGFAGGSEAERDASGTSGVGVGGGVGVCRRDARAAEVEAVEVAAAPPDSVERATTLPSLDDTGRAAGVAASVERRGAVGGAPGGLDGLDDDGGKDVPASVDAVGAGLVGRLLGARRFRNETIEEIAEGEFGVTGFDALSGIAGPPRPARIAERPAEPESRADGMGLGSVVGRAARAVSDGALAARNTGFAGGVACEEAARAAAALPG